MKKNAIKQISLVVIAGFMLSACGSGSSDSDSHQTNTGPNTSVDPKDPVDPTLPTEKTKNIMVFPISEYKVRAVNKGTPGLFFAIFENNRVPVNNSLSHNAQQLYKQDVDYNFNWNQWQDNILTKDKLYYSKNSQHAQFILNNTDSTLVLGYDDNVNGLTSTITFKNINLADQIVNSKQIMTSLFSNGNGFGGYSQRYDQLVQNFNQLSIRFESDATCHQYLTQKFNKPNIIFSDDSLHEVSNKTLSQWVGEKRAEGNDVIEETWAGLKVAYYKDKQQENFYQGLGYRDPTVVVEKEGKIYKGLIDHVTIYDYRDEYNNLTQFKAGICNSYNQSAAKSLSQAILSLPKS